MSNSFDSTLKYFDLEPEEMFLCALCVNISSCQYGFYCMLFTKIGMLMYLLWFVVKRAIAPQRREVVKKCYKKTAALMMGVGGLIMLLRYINEIVVSI